MSYKGYKDVEKRKAYCKEWHKAHYDTIKGYRPTHHFAVLHENLRNWIDISPKEFLFGPLKEPLMIYGNTNFRVHVPRSLLKRARIEVDKVTRQIKGSSAMHTANK